MPGEPSLSIPESGYRDSEKSGDFPDPAAELADAATIENRFYDKELMELDDHEEKTGIENLLLRLEDDTGLHIRKRVLIEIIKYIRSPNRTGQLFIAIPDEGINGQNLQEALKLFLGDDAEELKIKTQDKHLALKIEPKQDNNEQEDGEGTIFQSPEDENEAATSFMISHLQGYKSMNLPFDFTNEKATESQIRAWLLKVYAERGIEIGTDNDLVVQKNQKDKLWNIQIKPRMLILFQELLDIKDDKEARESFAKLKDSIEKQYKEAARAGKFEIRINNIKNLNAGNIEKLKEIVENIAEEHRMYEENVSPNISIQPDDSGTRIVFEDFVAFSSQEQPAPPGSPSEKPKPSQEGPRPEKLTDEQRDKILQEATIELDSKETDLQTKIKRIEALVEKIPTNAEKDKELLHKILLETANKIDLEENKMFDLLGDDPTPEKIGIICIAIYTQTGYIALGEEDKWEHRKREIQILDKQQRKEALEFIETFLSRPAQMYKDIKEMLDLEEEEETKEKKEEEGIYTIPLPTTAGFPRHPDSKVFQILPNATPEEVLGRELITPEQLDQIKADKENSRRFNIKAIDEKLANLITPEVLINQIQQEAVKQIQKKTQNPKKWRAYLQKLPPEERATMRNKIIVELAGQIPGSGQEIRDKQLLIVEAVNQLFVIVDPEELEKARRVATKALTDAEELGITDDTDKQNQIIARLLAEGMGHLVDHPELHLQKVEDERKTRAEDDIIRIINKAYYKIYTDKTIRDVGTIPSEDLIEMQNYVSREAKKMGYSEKDVMDMLKALQDPEKRRDKMVEIAEGVKQKMKGDETQQIAKIQERLLELGFSKDDVSLLLKNHKEFREDYEKAIQKVRERMKETTTGTWTTFENESEEELKEILDEERRELHNLWEQTLQDQLMRYLAKIRQVGYAAIPAGIPIGLKVALGTVHPALIVIPSLIALGILVRSTLYNTSTQKERNKRIRENKQRHRDLRILTGRKWDFSTEERQEDVVKFFRDFNRYLKNLDLEVDDQAYGTDTAMRQRKRGLREEIMQNFVLGIGGREAAEEFTDPHKFIELLKKYRKDFDKLLEVSVDTAVRLSEEDKGKFKNARWSDGPEYSPYGQLLEK